MNTIDIKNVEFVITHRCSGQCAHCPEIACRQGDTLLTKLDATRASAMISDLAERYELDSVTTVGGEPLLYPDTVCAIHKAAYEEGIPERRLITNGFFSRNPAKIREIAAKIAGSGVTSVLIAVDAFHEDSIPIAAVRQFAEALLDDGFYDLEFYPTWLVSPDTENMFNRDTRRTLDSLSDTGIAVNEGRIVRPEGAALQNLTKYMPVGDLTLPCGTVCGTQRPDQITSLRVDPNGTVYSCVMPVGSLREKGILELLDGFDPLANPAGRALIEGGVTALAEYASSAGVNVDTSSARDACSLCRAIWARL